MEWIVWIARSGAPWRDLPERYGPWETVYTRFRELIERGILAKMLHDLSIDADMQDVSFDSTSIRVHQQGTGAKKGANQPKSDVQEVGWPLKSMPLSTPWATRSNCFCQRGKNPISVTARHCCVAYLLKVVSQMPTKVITAKTLSNGWSALAQFPISQAAKQTKNSVNATGGCIRKVILSKTFGKKLSSSDVFLLVMTNLQSHFWALFTLLLLASLLILLK